MNNRSDSKPIESPDGDSLDEKVEHSLRRGNINFDFLNPVYLPDEATAPVTERRRRDRTGKRGLFNRGWKGRVLPGWYTWIWLTTAAACVAGLIVVWNSDHFLALLAVPFLLSMILASLIMFGLFLARPR